MVYFPVMQSPVWTRRSRIFHAFLFIFCLGTWPLLAANRPPRLQNVTITPVIGEHSLAILRGEIRDLDLQNTFKLTVSWGDGTLPQVFKYRAGTRWFTNSHFYYDDGGTNTASDTFTVNLRLNDSAGARFVTNRQITVTNTAPEVALSVAISPDRTPSEYGLELTEYVIPTGGSSPQGIAVGADNNIWFTESVGRKIGRITPAGVFREFAVTNAFGLYGIALGHDKRLYFCAFSDGKIGRINTNGAINVWKIPRAVNTPIKLPLSITRGPVANTLWFTMLGKGLGRITTTGVITDFNNLPSDIINPYGIALGPDNNIWFTDWGNDRIARRATDTGAITTYALTFLDTPRVIAPGPDGAMWFSSYQNGYIGRITTEGEITRFETGDNLPWGIVAGPDGAMWFLESRPTNCNIVRMSVDGTAVQRFALANGSEPREIVTGPDGALWFTLAGRNRIGRMRYTTTGNVVLHGRITEPGFNDRHWVTINWGDGSGSEVLALNPGIHTFSVPHTYASGPGYPITVTVLDDDTGEGMAQTSAAVP